jgi:hypothetical protein
VSRYTYHGCTYFPTHVLTSVLTDYTWCARPERVELARMRARDAAAVAPPEIAEEAVVAPPPPSPPSPPAPPARRLVPG